MREINVLLLISPSSLHPNLAGIFSRTEHAIVSISVETLIEMYMLKYERNKFITLDISFTSSKLVGMFSRTEKSVERADFDLLEQSWFSFFYASEVVVERLRNWYGLQLSGIEDTANDIFPRQVISLILESISNIENFNPSCILVTFSVS